MDVDRQWFKSNSGLNLSQTHRNDSFCTYAVLPDTCDVFVVPDALQDSRFLKSKLVTGSPFVRFYAGASLIVAGVKVGSLCIIDTKPRYDFDIDQRMNLLDLGDAVANLIRERRKYNLRAKKDRKDLMNEMMHNMRTPLMSLIIASSILNRDNNNSPPKDSEIFDQCIQDVVTAVKEIQVQVETTLNMSGSFFAREMCLPDSMNVSPSPRSSKERISNFGISNCSNISQDTFRPLPSYIKKQDSNEWEENFTLPGSTISEQS